MELFNAIAHFLQNGGQFTYFIAAVVLVALVIRLVSTD